MYVQQKYELNEITHIEKKKIQGNVHQVREKVPNVNACILQTNKQQIHTNSVPAQACHFKQLSTFLKKNNFKKQANRSKTIHEQPSSKANQAFLNPNIHIHWKTAPQIYTKKVTMEVHTESIQNFSNHFIHVSPDLKENAQIYSTAT